MFHFYVKQVRLHIRPLPKMFDEGHKGPASYSLSISSEIAVSNLTLSSCPVEYFILIKCMSLFVHTERNKKFIFKNVIFLKTKSLSISQFG